MGALVRRIVEDPVTFAVELEDGTELYVDAKIDKTFDTPYVEVLAKGVKIIVQFYKGRPQLLLNGNPAVRFTRLYSKKGSK